MRVLVLASRFPYPIEKGDKLRLFHQLRHLGEQFEVDLVAITSKEIRESELEIVRSYCKTVTIFKLPNYKRLLGTLVGFFRGWPASVSYFYNTRINNEISKIAIQGNYDLCYCQLIRMAPYAFSFPGPKIIDYMDAFAMGMYKRAQTSSILSAYIFNLEANRIISFEQSIHPIFDKHLIISGRDAESMDSYGINNLEIVGNGVDAGFFAYTNPEQRSAEYDIVFVGNLGYYPNVKAALYIIEEILPELNKFKPDARVLIAGARPARELTRLQNQQVTIWPWVEDIRDAYKAGRVFVAPLFHGSGQQNKILEAMSLGISCVTTAYVNESIEAKQNSEILISEDAKQMVTQILSLLEDSDLNVAISLNARKYVESRYSWAAVNQKLINLLKESLQTN